MTETTTPPRPDPRFPRVHVDVPIIPVPTIEDWLEHNISLRQSSVKV